MDNEERQRIWREWLDEDPVRAQIRKFFPELPDCVRMIGDRGHYSLVSFEEHDDGMTATIVHGRDSFLPGTGVFGVSLAALIPCNCGQWKPPTQEQRAAIKETMDDLMTSAQMSCDEPNCFVHQRKHP